MKQPFIFLETGKLTDHELQLVVIKKTPADPNKGYVPSYKFHMKNAVTGETMGYIDLRIGNNENLKYGGHSGYGVDEKFRGNRYSARSLRLLFPLAHKHGLEKIYVTCGEDNSASKRTCELAGGVLEETVDTPENNEMYKRGYRRMCRYRFDT
jgi:predicted acetyltransferase